MPLLELILDLSHNGRLTAKTNYGCDGWTAHGRTDLWRQSAPEGGYGNAAARDTMWPMAGVWLSRHLWEHYQFSGNIDFLRHFAWPVMEGAAAFLEDWLVTNEDSYLVTAPSSSPHNQFRQKNGELAAIGIGSTLDLSLAWDHLSNCISAGAILNVDTRRISGFERIRKRIPPPRVGSNGRIQEWMVDREIPSGQRRDLSPLFGLHPGRQITSELSPRLFEGANATLTHARQTMAEDSPWQALMWARLGKGDNALDAIATHAQLTSERGDQKGLYPNLMYADSGFKMHGSTAITSAMAEMLLQSHDGELHLLPALPEKWTNGHVMGLSARGGFRVDIHWEKTRITHCIVYATQSRLCRVRYRDGGTEFESTVGRCYLVTATFDVIEA